MFVDNFITRSEAVQKLFLENKSFARYKVKQRTEKFLKAEKTCFRF